MDGLRNGPMAMPKTDRAQDVHSLLNSIQELILPYIHAADEDADTKACGHSLQTPGGVSRTVLVEKHSPQELQDLLKPSLPYYSLGAPGVVESTRNVLRYSVNTWDRGFLDKLYASPDAAGLASELLLSVLNTNVHVYNVSPALTTIEKHTATALAQLFGFNGLHAGGITVPGGAASNTISMLIARNVMFPRIKTHGASSTPPLAIFTSAESHYSISTAAAQLGLGSFSVRSVPVDSHGRMHPPALKSLINDAVAQGHQPFYVCATSGTTVRGAYDPLNAIHLLTLSHRMWLHIDACWGGPAVFSPKLRHKFDGAELADSISINPHKMMGVPLTCSFLLGRDMRSFWKANNLEAGYLFHGNGVDDASSGDATRTTNMPVEGKAPPIGRSDLEDYKGVPAWHDVHDLATYTPQCGRRGDSLKMYLAWQYHGTSGFAAQVERAFAAAAELADALAAEPTVKLISERPPPCCQVCFYYVGDGRTLEWKEMSEVTRSVVQNLTSGGWMIDYSKGEEGEFMRAVCNRGTSEGVVSGLVKAIVAVGKEVFQGLG